MSLNGKESSALIDDEESDISKEQMNEDERMEAFFCPSEFQIRFMSFS